MCLNIKKGSALVITIILMAVLAILGISLLSVALADNKQAMWQDKKTQAHYIGRSGIYVGIDLLDKQLASKNYAELNTLVDDLNFSAGSLSEDDSEVSDKGSYSITYERFSPSEVKIISTGSLTDGTSEKVSLIMKIKIGTGLTPNPEEWFTGINLQKALKKSNKYIGYGVELGGNPTQSPKNGDDSIFQASVIYFKDNTKGVSFRQITNSIGVNFDAEIIYFESDVSLNKTFEPVVLNSSSDILNYRASNNGIIPKYSPAVGFEDYDRYKAFIGSETADRFSEYKDQFMPGCKYGVVRFGGDVILDEDGSKKNITTVIDKGYYFYKDGINLHNHTAGEDSLTGYKNLIRIKDDDAIIKVINGMFKSSSIKSGYIWNRK